MSVLRKKYQLPTIAQLTHINIDLPRLQAECDKFASKFTDVISANPALCMNHAELVKNVYDNFEQINLTELNGELMEYTDNIKERIRRRIVIMEHAQKLGFISPTNNQEIEILKKRWESFKNESKNQPETTDVTESRTQSENPSQQRTIA